MTSLYKTKNVDMSNEEAERGVIGSLLLEKSSHKEIVNLSEDYFFDDRLKIIFRVINSLHRKYGDVNMISVSSKLKEEGLLKSLGGRLFLVELTNGCYYNCEMDGAIQILREKAIFRSTLKELTDKLNKLQRGQYACIETEIGELSSRLTAMVREGSEEKTNVKNVFDNMISEQNDFLEKESGGEKLLGIPTCFEALNRATEGHRKEFVIVVSAGTSVGKTSFMINDVDYLLKLDKSVCIFSLEMSKVDLLGKLLALRMEVSSTKIMKGASDPEFVREFSAQQKILEDSKLEIYTELSQVDEIIMAMKAEKLKNKTDVFFLDYLQNLTDNDSNNEYSLITNSVKKLQKAARDLKVTLVELSQVSNETGKNGSMFDINGKGSGAIKAAADIFMFLKRDGDDDMISEIIRNGGEIPLVCIIVKARQGRIGSFEISFEPKIGRMEEVKNKNYQYETT